MPEIWSSGGKRRKTNDKMVVILTVQEYHIVIAVTMMENHVLKYVNARGNEQSFIMIVHFKLGTTLYFIL